MADYIEREKLYDFLTEQLDDHVTGMYIKGRNNGINVARSALHNREITPAADVVTVVRCRDCEKYHAEQGWCDEHSHFVDSDGEPCHPWESTEWKMFDHDYFCADGVRRMDGE